MNLFEPSTYRYLRMGGILLVFALLASYFFGLFTENILFVLVYSLLGIAILALIGFLIYQLVTNSAVMRQFALAVGGLFLILGIAFLFSVTDGSLMSVVTKKTITKTACLVGSTAFYSIYIIISIAILGIVVTEIRNLLKR